ncbi:uncharacterized protein P174DRAFT_296430 [Aspergillus novofumigatus IBT 16806]|uniref:Uncharacterized protein n=1 Tax=Aspergillus novofumigatus (strain IBT 16806) TaxID=1392255 RepID=A0A2I1BYE9_ASPN1|nr:uncharacterized protein P174DRAFT_296430 [Aspergillus novofumigatus IBT 16806]PKX90384.1 hypothetical protein P174DRAFT_296430 [Aspergillus novofumigatus IBT 16806]
MHIFTIAGHETKATSLQFTLLLLALHRMFKTGYTKVSSRRPAASLKMLLNGIIIARSLKLTIPLCVMFCPILVIWHTILTSIQLEALRLYPRVVTVPKSTSETQVPSTIKASSTFYRCESTST